MSQTAAPQAGRPANALLLLAAMFAIAWLMHPSSEPVPARTLTLWMSSPAVEPWAPTVDTSAPGRPADLAIARAGDRRGSDAEVADDVPDALVSAATAGDSPRAAPAGATPPQPDGPLAATPLLVASGFAAAAAPSLPAVAARPASGAASASLSTAFARTGGAVGLAFRKTGAGFRTAF